MKRLKYSPRLKQVTQSPTLLYIIFGLVALVSIYLLSPLNQISTIYVEGNNTLTDEEIINQSRLEVGGDFWGAYQQRQSYETALENQIPHIKWADISINGVNDLKLTVDEYRTVGFLDHEDGSYTQILDNGEVIENVENISGQAPIIINAEDQEKLSLLVEQLAMLDESVLSLISEIELVNSDRNPLLVRSYMNDGNQVIASIPTYAERLSLYPNLVESVEGQRGLFDLEAGAFFVPFASEENTSGSDEATDQVNE